ncbi:MAG TPA: SDR family oxidoreductase [Terriglobales bacterium]|nr:SDR family oxidoreductase [Terriglobales bacterium]
MEDSKRDWKQKVAVVTGGNRGIGAAIARKLAELEISVVICGRDQTQLDSVASEITANGGRCKAVACDLSKLTAVENLAEFVKTTFGHVDILVNNAGVRGFGGPLHLLPPDDWDKVINTNLRGVYYTIRAFAPSMIEHKSGDIINISSIASKNALPNGAVYAASKWGLNGLTYSVAEELRQYNIRVTVVCPGSVDTDLSPHTGKDKSRMLKPDDVAHVVAMLVTQAPQSFASEVVLRPTQKP